jgi:hypothetical protein
MRSRFHIVLNLEQLITPLHVVVVANDRKLLTTRHHVAASVRKPLIMQRHVLVAIGRTLLTVHNVVVNDRKQLTHRLHVVATGRAQLIRGKARVILFGNNRPRRHPYYGVYSAVQPFTMPIFFRNRYEISSYLLQNFLFIIKFFAKIIDFRSTCTVK